jgi:agmatine/peptidylarginine deiminase
MTALYQLENMEATASPAHRGCFLSADSAPMPHPVYDEDYLRLPANYANFLIINAAVMVLLMMIL